MRAYYDEKPAVLGDMGDNSFCYRWDIAETMMSLEGEAPVKQWICYEVVVWPTLTANKITQAVIAELWPSDYEQKLVNEYNAAQLGVYDEATATKKIEQYRAFLVERNRIKAQVDKDCEALGIK